MKFSWKNIENWRSWKMRFFWGGHFEFFKSAILNFFCFISVKDPALLYEVTFFSALWMVFHKSWKRSCSNFYAHDCSYEILSGIVPYKLQNPDFKNLLTGSNNQFWNCLMNTFWNLPRFYLTKYEII